VSIWYITWSMIKVLVAKNNNFNIFTIFVLLQLKLVVCLTGIIIYIH